MPITYGTFPHSDDKHRGSAARDQPNGVAGLNSSGFLLIPGNTIYCFGDNNQLDIQQKNPDLNFLQIYVDAGGNPTSYMGLITHDNKVLFNRDKGVSYGVAPLDYFGRVPWENHSLNLLQALSTVKLGDSVLFEDVTIEYTTESTFQLLYNVRITSLRPDKTTLRIKFRGRHSDVESTAEFQVRVEGNVIQTFSIEGDVHVQKQVDTEIEVGDTVQLFARVIDPGQAIASDLKICGEIVPPAEPFVAESL